MKRTYFDQNPREVEFLEKIGDRELTADEKKQLQKIRQYARQHQWKKSNKFVLKSDIPLEYRSKLKSMVEENDISICDFLCGLLDDAFKKSTSYQAIMDLYNYLNLTSDTINEDLASGILTLGKHKGQAAWIYDDGEKKAGMYSNNTWIIKEDELKALD